MEFAVIFKKRILTFDVSSLWIWDSIFSSIMILFYQDEAQEIKFQKFLLIWTYARAQNFFSGKFNEGLL